MESYKTIQGTAQAEYEEKKSRFIGQVAHVETEEEALAFLNGVRAANPMARHNVYAYVLREENRVYRQNAEAAKRSPVQGAAHPGGDDPEADPFLTGFNGAGW